MTGVDVAIVGGGPVGVTTALLLARRGCSVRVFERAVDVYDLPRAVGMDAEIQRVFQNAGLLDELRALTTPIDGAEFVDADGTRIIGGDIPPGTVSPLGHHPTVMYHQPWLEAMLRDAAVSAGVELHLGVEVFGIEQDDRGVTVEAGDGNHRARWVVAADGAASPIRKALGVAFVDQGFDQDWLVFDVALNGPDRMPRIAQQICDPVRPVTVVPGHANFRRWELQLQPGESAEEMTRPDRVWELIGRWLGPEDGELSRAVVYRFHATVAERMRVGRVFLAGDAAHQMPPFLGQGLCSGIRDGANLAWKLDLVRRGLATDRLLDSYDEERRPHAIDMVAHAVDTGRLIDQLAGRVDSGVGIEAAYGGGRGFPYLRDGLRHGDHPRVGKQLPQPVIDGAFFDDRLGQGFAVLVRSDSAVPEAVNRAWSAIGAAMVEVPPPLFEELLPAGGAVIVRPDRYVAAVANDAAEMIAATEALTATLGLVR